MANPITIRTARSQRLLNAYVDATLKGDGERASKLVDVAIGVLRSAREVYAQVLIPAQARFGELWEQGALSVSDEHCATQITIEQLYRLRSRVGRKKAHSLRAVLGALEGEQHYLGARIFADLLYEQGWHVDFVAAGTPVEDLAQYIRSRSPNLVALSLTIESAIPAAKKLLQQFVGKTSRPKFIIGGQAAGSHAFDGLPVDAIAGDLESGLAQVGAWFDQQTSSKNVESVLKHFGREIADARKRKSITQARLAVLAGLDRAYLSSIEQGHQNISIAALVRLSNALDLPLRTFFPDDT